jgi:glycerol-3-phosphate dehydrogenase
VVNAAGPWVDTLRLLDTDGVKGKRLQLSKGVHIVLSRSRLPLHQSVYFDVDGDSRMIFAIPRADVTYLGTTDTLYDDSIDQPEALQADIDYILKAANYMFPTADLKSEDVISTWSGLRPLIYQEGRSVSELSRKDEIFHAPSGLISMAGGKLTGYRKMAEKVVDLVCKELKIKVKSKTKQLQVSGANFESDKAFDQFINLRAGQCKQLQTTAKQITALAYRYGANIDLIIEKAFELYPQYQDTTLLLHAAELSYAIEYESVVTLCDYLIRRSGRLYFERPAVKEVYPFIAAEMGKLLGWSAEQLAENLAEFEAEFDLVMSWAK